MPKIVTVTLESAAPEDLVKFYEALGFPFYRTTQDPELAKPLRDCEYTSDEGEISIEIVRVDGNDQSPASAGLVVEVEDLPGSIESIPANLLQVVEQPHTVPWGSRCVLKDPDGRLVELSQEFSILSKGRSQ